MTWSILWYNPRTPAYLQYSNPEKERDTVRTVYAIQEPVIWNSQPTESHWLISSKVPAFQELFTIEKELQVGGPWEAKLRARNSFGEDRHLEILFIKFSLKANEIGIESMLFHIFGSFVELIMSFWSWNVRVTTTNVHLLKRTLFVYCQSNEKEKCMNRVHFKIWMLLEPKHFIDLYYLICSFMWG